MFVTSTRTEIPLSQVTTSATVITDKDIQAQQAETVLQVLRTVPGLDVVQSGSRGNTTSVFIRGSESDHVLVLIDGVEANSTTLGAFNFAHLTTENVERIEVLRGAGGEPKPSRWYRIWTRCFRRRKRRGTISIGSRKEIASTAQARTTSKAAP